MTLIQGSFYSLCSYFSISDTNNVSSQNGIKPIYVFDGKPPDMKSGELEKRSEKRKEAQESLEKAVEAGNQEDITKFNKRIIRVTQKHNDDCKRLLRLMGLPVIEAPSEAEAQCAQLCKDGKVYAAATEDMDALTFAAPRLVRHLSSGSAEKTQEYNLEKVIQGLELGSHDEFIDLCILMGCDYCDSIKGIGGKKGLDLIRKHKSIEKVVENLPNKDNVPKDWPIEKARQLFKEPNVTKSDLITEADLKMKDIDEEGIVEFLCKENDFDEKRVRNAIQKCRACKPKSAQTRIDSFFQMKPSEGVKKSPSVQPKTSGKQTKKTNSSSNKRFRK